MLDIIQELCCASNATNLHYLRDDLLQFFLSQKLVDIPYFLRHKLVEDQSTSHRFDDLILDLSWSSTYFYLTLDVGMLGKLAFIHGNDHFFLAVESHAFTEDYLLRSRLLALGYIIQTQNHVLRRYCNWRAIGRVQNVVCRKHQGRRFQNRLMT